MNRPGATTARVDWLVFLALSFFWGSSYLFIRIGVETLPPLTLVMLRLLVGSLLLAGVVLAAREPLPRDPRMIGHLTVMAILSIAVPFWLITWGEQQVPSSLASILNSTVPLFTIVFGAIVLADETITVNRAAGLLVGFVGVIVVTGQGLTGAGADPSRIVALLLSAVSYGAGAVYARRNARGLRPMISAVGQVSIALLIVGILAFVFEHPLDVSLPASSLFAVVWLGVFGSGLAYLAFFRLLGRWGPTRTSLVAYLLPVWGILLGAAVLGEQVDSRILLGTALIVGGVGLVNSRFGRRPLLRPSAPAEPTT
ncbi:MAG: DMT family transporter [Chloroflexota bacterium]